MTSSWLITWQEFFIEGSENYWNYNFFYENIMFSGAESLSTYQWKVKCRKKKLILANAPSSITGMNSLHKDKQGQTSNSHMLVLILSLTILIIFLKK